MLTVFANSLAPLLTVTLLPPAFARPIVRFKLLQTEPASLTVVVAVPAIKALPLVRMLPPQSASVPWFVRIPATYVALVTNAA